MKNSPVIYITTSLLFLYMIAAQKAFAQAATPDPEIANFPSLLIKEVDFKNSEHDSALIYVLDDGNNGNGGNIKGMSLKDDSVFFTLENDIYIRSGEIIKITFKNESEEITNTNISLTKSGLTGTTEQLIVLNNNNQILDALCWANNKPTETEISELQDLFNDGGWNSNEITSCINSDEIGTNEIIQRKNLQDTNTKNDWELLVEEIAEEETDEAEIVEKETDEEPITNICKSDIFINEILPNPKGKDTNYEWIELINSSGAQCSLYGWKIDDQEGGSKAYKITSNDLVPPEGFVLLPSWKTKINLNNTEDSVRLFDQKETLIDYVNYENSPEQQSYAFNTEEEIFKWNKQLTPLLPNIFPEDEQPEKKIKEEPKEKVIENGTLSKDIKITEVFPNPSGADKGSEWIEIYNDSQKSVNLGNWSIESTTKTYTFEDVSIEADSFMTLSDTELGFSLKNSNETLTLKDFNSNEISSLEYDNSEENQSFMEIKTIQGETTQNSWVWTKDATPGEENHENYIYKGIVESFDNLNGKLKLKLNKDMPEEEMLDIFTLLTGDQINDSLFIPETEILVTIRKDDGNWILEDYSVLKESSVKQEADNSNNILYIVLSALPPLGFLGYSAVRKFGLIKIV